MDLTSWLLRQVPVRPLIVATPGGTAARLAVERVARVRGWRPAVSPAEANLLVLSGPGGAPWTSIVDAVWDAVPAPRVRVQVTSAERAEEALPGAVAELRDPNRQRSEATRLAETPRHAGHNPDHHAGHQMSGGHHGHDTGAMDLPGGVAMADRAADRDGLMLDRLTVPLGPALADWPAGLVVHTVLQGDVIQDASVEVLGTARESRPEEWPAMVRRLDSCARLLAVAGWEHAAVRARWLRDQVLLGRSDRQAIERWARRVRRSRVLRWSLTGLGMLPGARWDDTMFAGDAYDRLLRRLDFAIATDRDTALAQAALDAMPELLLGLELAGARLMIASLDPDTELVGAVAHG